MTLDRALGVVAEIEGVLNSRQKDYGDPAIQYERLAKLWAPILGQKVTPAQVMLCMVQLKISRLIETPAHRDSAVDLVGYSALYSAVTERN